MQQGSDDSDGEDDSEDEAGSKGVKKVTAAAALHQLFVSMCFPISMHDLMRFCMSAGSCRFGGWCWQLQ